MNFKKIYNESKVTDYDMSDYKQELEEEEADELDRLWAEEQRHHQELVEQCQEDPEHLYVVTSVKATYSDSYFDKSATVVRFDTIEDIYDYVKEHFAGETVVKIMFKSFTFKGCREVRIIDDYDD